MSHHSMGHATVLHVESYDAASLIQGRLFELDKSTGALLQISSYLQKRHGFTIF